MIHVWTSKMSYYLRFVFCKQKSFVVIEDFHPKSSSHSLFALKKKMKIHRQRTNDICWLRLVFIVTGSGKQALSNLPFSQPSVVVLCLLSLCLASSNLGRNSWPLCTM